jgi:hypothetical protein
MICMYTNQRPWYARTQQAHCVVSSAVMDGAEACCAACRDGVCQNKILPKKTSRSSFGVSRMDAQSCLLDLNSRNITLYLMSMCLPALHGSTPAICRVSALVIFRCSSSALYTPPAPKATDSTGSTWYHHAAAIFPATCNCTSSYSNQTL